MGKMLFSTLLFGHDVRFAPYLNPGILADLSMWLYPPSQVKQTPTQFCYRHDVAPKSHKSHLHFKKEVLGSSGWTCPRALSVSYACLNYSQSELTAVKGKKEGFLEEIACLKCVSGYISVWAFWMLLKSGKAVGKGRVTFTAVLRIFMGEIYFNRNPCDLEYFKLFHRFCIRFMMVKYICCTDQQKAYKTCSTGALHGQGWEPLQ